MEQSHRVQFLPLLLLLLSWTPNIKEGPRWCPCCCNVYSRSSTLISCDAIWRTRWTSRLQWISVSLNQWITKRTLESKWIDLSVCI